MTARLEHVNFTISNLDRAIDFYCALLGFHVRWRGTSASGTPAAHIGTDDQYLAIFEGTPDPAVRDKPYDRVGMNHLAFVVDDLDAMRTRLVALGVEPGDEMDYEPGRRLYFRDHDGIEVELVQYESVPA